MGLAQGICVDLIALCVEKVEAKLAGFVQR
jgi:hypothetical protein